MAFSLYGLLDRHSPALTIDTLASKLTEHFSHEENFSIEFESLPFSKNKSLALKWDDWLVRLSYEEGDHVKDDSEEIQRRSQAAALWNIPGIDRRIRVVFGDDDQRAYTNQCIYIMDFLGKIPGIYIYDPQQNDFVQ